MREGIERHAALLVRGAIPKRQGDARVGEFVEGDGDDDRRADIVRGRALIGMMLLGALALGVFMAALTIGYSRERDLRAENRASLCELRDAVIDVLVLGRANPTYEIGFYELSISRLHRIEYP